MLIDLWHVCFASFRLLLCCARSLYELSFVFGVRACECVCIRIIKASLNYQLSLAIGHDPAG